MESPNGSTSSETPTYPTQTVGETVNKAVEETTKQNSREQTVNEQAVNEQVLPNDDVVQQKDLGAKVGDISHFARSMDAIVRPTQKKDFKEARKLYLRTTGKKNIKVPPNRLIDAPTEFEQRPDEDGLRAQLYIDLTEMEDINLPLTQLMKNMGGRFALQLPFDEGEPYPKRVWQIMYGQWKDLDDGLLFLIQYHEGMYLRPRQLQRLLEDPREQGSLIRRWAFSNIPPERALACLVEFSTIHAIERTPETGDNKAVQVSFDYTETDIQAQRQQLLLAVLTLRGAMRTIITEGDDVRSELTKCMGELHRRRTEVDDNLRRTRRTDEKELSKAQKESLAASHDQLDVIEALNRNSDIETHQDQLHLLRQRVDTADILADRQAIELVGLREELDREIALGVKQEKGFKRATQLVAPQIEAVVVDLTRWVLLFSRRVEDTTAKDQMRENIYRAELTVDSIYKQLHIARGDEGTIERQATAELRNYMGSMELQYFASPSQTPRTECSGREPASFPSSVTGNEDRRPATTDNHRMDERTAPSGDGQDAHLLRQTTLQPARPISNNQNELLTQNFQSNSTSCGQSQVMTIPPGGKMEGRRFEESPVDIRTFPMCGRTLTEDYRTPSPLASNDVRVGGAYEESCSRDAQKQTDRLSPCISQGGERGPDINDTRVDDDIGRVGGSAGDRRPAENSQAIIERQQATIDALERKLQEQPSSQGNSRRTDGGGRHVSFYNAQVPTETTQPHQIYSNPSTDDRHGQQPMCDKRAESEGYPISLSASNSGHQHLPRQEVRANPPTTDGNGSTDQKSAYVLQPRVRTVEQAEEELEFLRSRMAQRADRHDLRDESPDERRTPLPEETSPYAQDNTFVVMPDFRYDRKQRIRMPTLTEFTYDLSRGHQTTARGRELAIEQKFRLHTTIDAHLFNLPPLTADLRGLPPAKWGGKTATGTISSFFQGFEMHMVQKGLHPALWATQLSSFLEGYAHSIWQEASAQAQQDYPYAKASLIATSSSTGTSYTAALTALQNLLMGDTETVAEIHNRVREAFQTLADLSITPIDPQHGEGMKKTALRHAVEARPEFRRVIRFANNWDDFTFTVQINILRDEQTKVAEEKKQKTPKAQYDQSSSKGGERGVKRDNQRGGGGKQGDKPSSSGGTPTAPPKFAAKLVDPTAPFKTPRRTGDQVDTRECYNCQQRGHISSACPLPRNPRPQDRQKVFGLTYVSGGKTYLMNKGTEMHAYLDERDVPEEELGEESAEEETTESLVGIFCNTATVDADNSLIVGLTTSAKPVGRSSAYEKMNEQDRLLLEDSANMRSETRGLHVINVTINGVKTACAFDTGASVTLVSMDVVRHLDKYGTEPLQVITSRNTETLRAVSGGDINIRQTVMLFFALSDDIYADVQAKIIDNVHSLIILGVGDSTKMLGNWMPPILMALQTGSSEVGVPRFANTDPEATSQRIRNFSGQRTVREGWSKVDSDKRISITSRQVNLTMDIPPTNYTLEECIGGFMPAIAKEEFVNRKSADCVFISSEDTHALTGMTATPLIIKVTEDVPLGAAGLQYTTQKAVEFVVDDKKQSNANEGRKQGTEDFREASPLANRPSAKHAKLNEKSDSESEGRRN